MNVVLLSGGSGKRLWPLSNDVRSKQFIKLFKNTQNEYESMVQRVYKQLKEIDENINITIATNEAQVEIIKNQLDDSVDLCVESARRDTFPAIALATTFLYDEKKLDLNDVVIVCPIDSYVEIDYFQSIKKLYDYAKNNDSNLTLMGVEPTYPSEKYGYIIPNDNNALSKVKEFKEKPSEEKAVEYIEQKALWNCGVFAFKIQYMLEKIKSVTGFDNYSDINKNYSDLEKISFDYAVVEKEKNINVLRYSGNWKDIGTWNTLTEEMNDTIVGNALVHDCNNVHVVNELNLPVVCVGLDDVVAVASENGILLCRKDKSDYIKSIVDKTNDIV